MTRKTILVILLLTCAVGLGVNVHTVVTRERALSKDSLWRFRIDGFDPLDPFRGRYIEFTVPDLFSIEADDDGTFPSWLTEGVGFYAILGNDDEGSARIVSISPEKPQSDGDWLTVRYKGSGEIEPVFSRYYVIEKDADELDRLFTAEREAAYITVRISDGVGVITGIGFGVGRR